MSGKMQKAPSNSMREMNSPKPRLRAASSERRWLCFLKIVIRFRCTCLPARAAARRSPRACQRRDPFFRPCARRRAEYTGARQVAPDATKRLWADGRFRLFLSHKAQVKRETAELKQNLLDYGVSAFVAHEDIHPTKEWQDEIENALATMDGFVALMTADFHDSNWTDQEVGYALARAVPIIAVRLEQNPYGFLGKFQALNSDWKSAPEGIVKLLIKNDRMLSAYISALSNCPFFDAGNTLANILQSIETVSEKQIDEIIEAVNTNVELQGSYGFNGTKPTIYGKGLVPHLHRWGPRRYVMSKTRPGKIEPFAP